MRGQQNPGRRFRHKQLGYIGIGNRRVVGGLNARGRLAALFDSAPFYAPRTSSITQTRGSGTPTITRATVATVQNNDGYLVTALSGEIRQQGARRVRNLLAKSEDFSVWTKEAGVTIDDLGGGEWLINFNGANGAYYFSAANTLPAGSKFISSIEIACESGSGTVSLQEPINAYFANTPTNVTTEWVRVASPLSSVTSAGNPNGGIWLRAPSGITTLKVRKVQIEDVTAQTTQTAGEYVSVGVLSAPFHGAGVDGVKYFDTDISGNPIPAETRDGSVVEAAATNLCLYSKGFRAGIWVADQSGTGITPIATENYAVAPDGTLTATRLQMDKGVGVGYSRWQQAIGALAAGTYTDAIWMKTNDGSTKSVGLRNFATGEAKTVTGTWTRFEMTGAAGATTADIQVMLWSTFSSSQTADISIWGGKCELGSYATSDITTTTAAVTRNKDVLDDQVSGNLTAAAGSVAFQWTPSHAPSGTIALAGSYVDASNYTMVLAKKVENLALQSQTFEANPAWTIGGNVTKTGCSNTDVAPDGTTTMDRLVVTAGALQKYLVQSSLAISAGATTFSLYAKYVNHQWVTLWLSDGATIFQAAFDLLNGVVGSKTASATTTLEETDTPGIYRITLTATTLATAAGELYIAANDADSLTVNAWVSDGTERVGLWGAQLEANSFVSPYVATTTAAASNTFAILRKVIAGAAYDAYIQHVYASGTTYDISLRWGASGSNLAVDGTLGTAHANTDPAQLGTRWQWGADGNSLQQAGAAIKEKFMWPTGKTDTQLRAITS